MGRRLKFQPGDRVVGKEDAAASFRGRRGVIVRRTYNAGEYWVCFDDRPDVDEAAYSHWLERESVMPA